MTETTHANTHSVLTPEQSADVILWQAAAMNERSRENGWKDKIDLGHVALRCAFLVKFPNRSGKETPLLSYTESTAGYNCLTQPPNSETTLPDGRTIDERNSDLGVPGW